MSEANAHPQQEQRMVPHAEAPCIYDYTQTSEMGCASYARLFVLLSIEGEG